MSRSLSRSLLIIEAIVIVTPVTLLALLEIFNRLIDNAFSGPSYYYPNHFYDVVFGLLALVCLISIVSGWRLITAFLCGGADELRKQRVVWWIMLFPGVLVLAIALGSDMIPPSPVGSLSYAFREDFHFFTLGTFSLLPLSHLLCERYLRRATS